MKTQEDGSQLDCVGSIVNRATSGHYWLGAPQEQAISLIERLPIALPSTGEYLFKLQDTTLFISEAKRGISVYRPTDATKIGAVGIERGGIHLRIRGIRGLEEVILIQEAVPISPKAVSIRALTAPVELLDAYSELRTKGKSGPLTEAERDRLDDLIDKIGDEYEKRRRERIIPSSRSTPMSCGESRSSGFRSTGG